MTCGRDGMGSRIFIITAAFLVLLSPSSAQVCTDFGKDIEGAAVDKQGNFFAVNGADARNTIASAAGGTCGVLATVNDKAGTVLNSIRVLPDGSMLSSDKANGRVVLVSADRKTASTWCSGGGMVEPNDLALSKQGWVYISGQRWTDDTTVGDGGVWLCKGPGQAQQLFLTGRTNGIELSPDEKYLYVSEAFNKGGVPISNKILRFTVKPDGTLGDKTVFRDFAKDGTAYSDVDGMRTDTSGNLYVTRYADGKIVLLSPAGSILKSFQLPFAHITNLELGGKDGKTLVAVGGCGPGPVSKTKQPATKGCVQVVGAQATPGRAWQMLQDGLPPKLG